MRKRTHFGLLFLLLLLLIASAVLFWPGERVTRTTAPASSTCSAAEAKALPRNAELVASSSTPKEKGVENQLEEPPPKPAAEEPPREAVLVLKFLDPDNHPATAVFFRYCLDDRKTYESLWSDVRSADDSGLNALTASGQTDSEGVCRLRLTGNDVTSIRLQLTDPQWALREFPPFPGKLPRGVGLWKISGKTQEISISVCAADRREIEIRYENGAPFEGEVRVWFTSADRQVGAHRTFKLDGAMSVVLEKVPADLGVHVLCLSRVLGFEARSNFDFPSVAGPLLTCVVKHADRPQAGIRVEVTGIRNDELCRVLILDGAGSAWGGDDLTGPATYWWLEGDVRQRFFVVVRVGRKGGAVFQSDAITLKNGEFVVVMAEPKAPVAYTLRAVNERGNALWPAILSSNTLVYNDFSVARRNRGEGSCDQNSGRATGDSGGKVTLLGVASSVTELLLDAEGYNPRIIKVSGQPGQTIDLGRFVLSEASGSLVVKLLNRAEGVTYRCMLLQPGGSPVTSASPERGGTFTLNRLPLREYCVYVDAGNGLRGVSTTIVLTQDSPSTIIELDVAGCQVQK